MYLVSKQHIQLIIIRILLISSSVRSLSIGYVNRTRFTSIDHLNINSIWLSTFNTWSQCVCNVLVSNYSSIAIALNMYTNGSCQLFTTLPSTYRIEPKNDSTLILLKQLPAENLAPCCSNLPWLISRMNASQQKSGNITSPSFVLIDDNDYLVTVGYRGPLVQFNRTTLNVIQSTTIVGNATSVSYRNGLYYIAGCSSTCNVFVFSSKNLSLITSFPMAASVVREITFVRNNSLMLVASYSQNQTALFNVLSRVNYTSSTPSFIPVYKPCGLHVVNDTFIYAASWYSSGATYPVYTLVLSNNTWTVSPLVNTTPSSGEKIFQTTVDSCGRLWLAITGFGIRIFDPWGRSLLYEWPVTIGMDGFLLLDDYELFIADYAANQILHFNPNINQCTS